MRTLVPVLALAAVSLVAAPLASAQVAPDSAAHEARALLAPPAATGLYVDALVGSGYVSSLGVLIGARASLGYRLPSGLSLGATATALSYGTAASAFSFGPDVRYTRALDARTVLDLRASGAVGFTDGVSSAGYRASGLGALAEAMATRRFGLGGGVTLAATGGAFGGVSRAFAVTDAPDAATREADVVAQAGLVLGLQAEFDALGGRFAVGPMLPLRIVNTGSSAAGYGTHIHRGSVRGYGLLTYTRKNITVSLF